MADRTALPRGGRHQEAARNDVRIRQSARAVFTANPAASMTDVAAHAGVGISALYKRYANKEALLRSLCADALDRFTHEVERALTGTPPWTAFSDFLRRAVEIDATALTITLAGTFTPTQEMFAAAERAERLLVQLVDRTQRAGALRDDIVAQDISLLLEQLASLKITEPERDHELRQRSLTIALDGLRSSHDMTTLTAAAPTADELGARWR